MLPTIALDMDGTIVSLYDVPGWLQALKAHDATPYYNAAELYDMDYLNDLVELYKAAGGHVCIVSWTARGDIPHSYYIATQAAKMLWLRENLPAIDDVRIVKYGTPKFLVVDTNNISQIVLFDDEAHNREAFKDAGGQARHPKNIFRFMLAQLNKA